MAKFQLCEYRMNKPTGILKSDPENKWDRGIACVNDFGGDIEYIIDDKGKKLKAAPYNFRLLGGYGAVAIDTEEPTAFYLR